MEASKSGRNHAMSEIQRVAIVTGAAGGIGRAMTQGLLAAGIRVAGVDRDREPLEARAASAREEGRTAELLTIQTDLTNDSAADEITKPRTPALRWGVSRRFLRPVELQPLPGTF